MTGLLKNGLLDAWYTTSELVALGLPGLPATRQGWDSWLAKNEIDSRHPGKVRRRSGRGGGTERHISVLPGPARSLLTVRYLKTEQPEALETLKGASPAAPPPEGAGETALLRRDAILCLLTFRDAFVSAFDGPMEAARYQFCAAYAAGTVEGLPDWVRLALKRKTLAVNTLRRWENLRENGDWAALADRRGNRKGTGVLDVANDGAVARWLAAVIVKTDGVSTEKLRESVKGKFGPTLDVGGKEVPLPDLRTFQRWRRAWVESHREVVEKLGNPDGFRSRMRIRGRNMNHWVQAPNQLWEIDASPADVLTTDGRYSIYVAVDVFTRRMIGYVTKTPRSEAVLLLLRRAILDWGVPEVVRTDNGSDFTSREAMAALAALGIRTDVTNAYSPQEKGTVERHIGTLQHGLMPLLPGYVGHSVADRKKIEARKSFSDRLGATDEALFGVDLSAGELQDYIDRWISQSYHHARHTGTGMNGLSPFQKLASWQGTLRRVANERALDLLLAPIAGKSGRRTVGASGIRLDRACFLHPDMVPGTEVFCRHDPKDFGRLYVYDETGTQFLYVATCAERLGQDPGQLVRECREAQARRIREEVAPIQKDIRAMKPRDLVDSVLAASTGTINLVSFPKPADEYSTPALDAARDAVRLESDHAVQPVSLGGNAASTHAALVAEMASPGPDVVQLPESPRQRFRRALELEARLDTGKPLGSEEARWLAGYQRTAEYRGERMTYEDFGGSLYGAEKGTAPAATGTV